MGRQGESGQGDGFHGHTAGRVKSHQGHGPTLGPRGRTAVKGRGATMSYVSEDMDMAKGYVIAVSVPKLLLGDRRGPGQAGMPVHNQAVGHGHIPPLRWSGLQSLQGQKGGVVVIDRLAPNRELERRRGDELAGVLPQKVDIGREMRQAVRDSVGTRQERIMVAGKEEDRALQLFQTPKGIGHRIQGCPKGVKEVSGYEQAVHPPFSGQLQRLVKPFEGIGGIGIASQVKV